ncbi:hypothetical protein SAY87_020300 [Trapa incisa]|uniref:Uncharacterized protein n=1 Tax=Trapa incisa TaxID=236973 RepID=A0AAN7K5U2_9MYRT|nr:hypothetical protein SAY87_020300 [Trapa incisa]
MSRDQPHKHSIVINQISGSLGKANDVPGDDDQNRKEIATEADCSLKHLDVEALAHQSGKEVSWITSSLYIFGRRQTE